MVKTIKLRKAGGSVTATLPKEIVDRLNVGEGELLHVVEKPDGVLLTPYDPVFEEAMKLYRRGARKYRNALRELSK